MQNKKWLVAILPPPEISAEIVAFQKEIERFYGAVHAQKIPPHITVIPPFETEDEKLKKFISILQQTLNSKNKQAIQIQLENFQRFEQRTLFVDIRKNQAFEAFCKEIKQLFNRQKLIKQRVEKHFFVPHITLANKDLNKKNFKQAWEMFSSRTYQKTFELNSFSIMVHKENEWVEFDTILF